MLPDSPSHYKQLITLDKTHKANSGTGLQAVQGGDPWEQGEHKASSWSTPAVCLGFRATHSTRRRGHRGAEASLEEDTNRSWNLLKQLAQGGDHHPLMQTPSDQPGNQTPPTTKLKLFTEI